MVNENGAIKQSRSRKWLLVLVIVALATMGAFLPPMISAWVFGESKPLVIISGTEWVSVISMIVSAYIAGNVYQKREEMRANPSMRFHAEKKSKEEGEA